MNVAILILMAALAYGTYSSIQSLSSVYLGIGLQNHSSLVQTDQYSTYILAKLHATSSQYLFLSRNNTPSSNIGASLLEHNANYWIQSPLLISDYDIKGFSLNNRMLQYVVAVHTPTQELHILTYKKVINLY